MSDNFSNLKEILNGVQFRNVNPAFAKTIENWDNIVGSKFAHKSEISEFLNKSNKIYLLVHVCSSPLVQELGFFKRNIIAKIKNEYNIELADIIIKASAGKKNSGNEIKEDSVIEFYNKRPNEGELAKIQLTDEEVNKIKASVENIKTLSEKQKREMLDVIFRDLKTQEWMKKNGFPVCEKCGRVLTQKTFGEKNLCRFCKDN